LRRASDQNRAEFARRRISIHAPAWTRPQLLAIPKLGFPKLGLKVHPSVSEEIVSQAHGNPMLVQDYCFRLCKELGIFATSDARKVVVSAATLRKIFEEAARDTFGSRVRPLLTADEQLGLKNQRYSLTFSGLLLKVLDSKAASQPLNPKTICDHAKNRLVAARDKKRVTVEQIVAAGSDLVQKLKDNRLGEMTLNLKDNTFYIQHPSFKVHIHWDLLPYLTGEAPLLEKYQQHTLADIA
jgi:hypothetical protein